MVITCTVEIRLKPRAKRDQFKVHPDKRIDAAVTSPPVDGKANAHLISMMAKQLRIPKSACTIIRGEHNRNKVVAIDGLNLEEVMGRIGSVER